jgi:diguanylate cyclase (GGDEF)-like protein/PAS domain S-box-containing protein
VAGGATRFARRWARALAGAAGSSGTARETEALLTGLTSRLAGALQAGQFRPEAGYEVGAALVEGQFRGTRALRVTIDLVGTYLVSDCPVGAVPPAELAARTAALQGALAAGFADAARTRDLREQEEMQRAALAAVRRAELSRRASEARFRAVFDGAAVGIGVVDLTGRVIDVNAAFGRMLGHEPDAMRGRLVSELVVPAVAPQTWSKFIGLLAGDQGGFRTETDHLRPDGQPVHLDLSMSMVRGEDGMPRFAIGVAVDVTERRQLADRLWQEARQDPLTGLPNRTLFFERLRELLAGESAGQIGLCYLDLDGFKSVNDTVGHDVGDRLLVAVARRLTFAVPDEECFVARLGGDEFVVLAAHCPDSAGAVAYAEAVLAALTAPFRIGDHEFTISASVGVLDMLPPAADPAEVMRLADLALYRAKADGKGRWARHDPARAAPQVTRHRLTTTMPAALHRGEFFLEYQPLVSLVDASLRGVEALVRWRHPDLGVLPPGDFIDVAEETGLIVPLGRWVLAEACRQQRAWEREVPGSGLLVSVNLAVVQLHDPKLVSDVQEVLDQTGLLPELLQLELTESAMLGDAPGPLDALRELAGTGVWIAVDDFGTGYSNLTHLSRLPIRGLKIAGEFLDRMRPGVAPPDPAHDKIVSAMIALAHALGLRVTAEGVEFREQADRLRALDCDLAQGWYYGRPCSAPEITRRLRGEPG